MNTLHSYKILTITHKRTPLKDIGQFVLSNVDDDQVLGLRLKAFKAALNLQELMYLATCNRIMFFFVGDQPIDAQFIAAFQAVVYPELGTDMPVAAHADVYEGIQAIQHLLEVASSVDSLVIGEREILRQLRLAYDRCQQLGTTGDSIRMAITLAVNVAKKVYSTTKIGQKPVSVVSLAVRQLLAKHPAKDARILLLGAGQTNTLVGKFLVKYGFTNCTVFNRSLGNAELLAESLNGTARELTALSTYSKGFDIIIACTGATDPILTKALYEQLLQGETDTKIIIDLSIPNNVAAEVANAEQVDYIEIDGLKELVNENLAFREREVVNAQALIQQEVQKYNQTYQGRQVELALKEVPQQIKAIRQHALTSVFKKEVASLDDDTQELIDRMMAYMEKRCIAIPIKAAKEHLAGVVSTKK